MELNAQRRGRPIRGDKTGFVLLSDNARVDNKFSAD